MKNRTILPLGSVILALAIAFGTVPCLHCSEQAVRKAALASKPAAGPKAPTAKQYDPAAVFAELERGVTCALGTYSNVHRGEGQYSRATTELFEEARKIVRAYLGLGAEYEIIFGSIREIDILAGELAPGADFRVLYSDRETGLRFGVAALAVKKDALPGTPPVVGGGEVDDVSDATVAWSEAPAKFEPGTPNITGVITFAKALLLMQKTRDKDIFRKAMALPQAPAAEDDPFAGLSGKPLLFRLRETLVGREVRVPAEEGMVKYVNLDNGASTPTFDPIMQSAFRALRETDEGAKRLIADVRAECASYFNAPDAEYGCIFTSNTTESVNIASELVATFRGDGIEPVVIGTDLEHNSNELPWRSATVLHAPVDEDGFIDMALLEKLLREYNKRGAHGSQKICIVTASGASNVLGTFNDIRALSALAHTYGAYFHADAAQLAAHRDVDMAGLGIDLLSCSGHKMYAPFGSGCLVARKGLLEKFGKKKLGEIRACGDRNVMGIAALGKAMRALKAIGLDALEKDERVLTARVLRGLADINDRYGGDTILVFGIRDWEKLGNKGPVVAFHVNGIPHNIVAVRLAEIRGVGVRTGCFCAHRLLKFLFDARGKEVAELVRQGKAPGLVRVSIGLENTTDDIDAFLATLVKIIDDPDSRKFIPGDQNCRYCAGKALVTHAIAAEIDAFVRGVVRNVYDVDTEHLVQ